jgi:hypothetical protein
VDVEATHGCPQGRATAWRARLCAHRPAPSPFRRPLSVAGWRRRGTASTVAGTLPSLCRLGGSELDLEAEVEFNVGVVGVEGEGRKGSGGPTALTGRGGVLSRSCDVIGIDSIQHWVLSSSAMTVGPVGKGGGYTSHG